MDTVRSIKNQQKYCQKAQQWLLKQKQMQCQPDELCPFRAQAGIRNFLGQSNLDQPRPRPRPKESDQKAVNGTWIL